MAGSASTVRTDCMRPAPRTIPGPLAVVDTRTGEPLRMTFDSPRCRHCGRRFAPETMPVVDELGNRGFVTATYARTHCRQCRNAFEAALYAGGWTDARL